MHVDINGETRDIPESVNLRALLELLSLSGQRVAVELNKEVIRRSDWEKVFVANNDRIEIIHFVGGG